MGCARTKKEEGSMAALNGLKPEKVFEYFEKLCSVPHGSGNTKLISDLCVGFAKELGLRYRQEACDNLIIWKDGSAGYEQSEPIILQGHIDMVCAKTDECTKDMAREGLDLCTDGEWVWADQTSLGGDNGIAVAMILAILADDTLPHPPLEAVFTVDEEVGMDGAFALDCSDLKGRKLLNLDSEEEGIFTVSCAGGRRSATASVYASYSAFLRPSSSTFAPSGSSHSSSAMSRKSCALAVNTSVPMSSTASLPVSTSASRDISLPMGNRSTPSCTI